MAGRAVENLKPTSQEATSYSSKLREAREVGHISQLGEAQAAAIRMQRNPLGDHVAALFGENNELIEKKLKNFRGLITVGVSDLNKSHEDDKSYLKFISDLEFQPLSKEEIYEAVRNINSMLMAIRAGCYFEEIYNLRESD